MYICIYMYIYIYRFRILRQCVALSGPGQSDNHSLLAAYPHTAERGRQSENARFREHWRLEEEAV